MNLKTANRLKKVSFINDPEAVRAAFRPFLDLDMAAWQGLPGLTAEALSATFGEASTTEDAELGWYPAQRRHYEMDTASGGFFAYVRDSEVILIETVNVPPTTILKEIGAPDAVMPNELLSENAYVHEYLFCKRGLLLSVAEPFDKEKPEMIMRCRGIRPLDGPDDFGPELFMSFEDRIVW